MGWVKRLGVATGLFAAATLNSAVAYNNISGTPIQETRTIGTEEPYRKELRLAFTLGERPYASKLSQGSIANDTKVNDTKYKVANAVATGIATILAAGFGFVGYKAARSRREVKRPAELDDADRHDMPLIRPINYDSLSTEERAELDRKLSEQEVKLKEKEARIRAKQLEETNRKMFEYEQLLGGNREIEQLKVKTLLAYNKNRIKSRAPYYENVVSEIVDGSVRHDFVGAAKTKQSVLGRFDINADQLERIAKPYALELLKIEQAKEEVEKAVVKTRAEQIAEEMRRAVVKLV